jgi:ParB family transcriptional regulator, chromosome partitioning protein
MPTLNPIKHEIPPVVPAGKLRHLSPDEIKPSTNNPRHLFDTSPMQELKKNIAEHGVLVPITVYQAKGQTTFSILDGERRYRCVVELTREGVRGPDDSLLKLPANIVEPPTKIAGLLYMFSIHNFREGWELMPTALALKTVINEIDEDDNNALSKLTGLSVPQIERCKLLLDIPKHFQEMSLDPDPKARIPSNFWIEAAPVVDAALEEIPTLRQLGRTRSMEKLVEKYRAKKIKSVIHFRRIMNALELSEGDDAFRSRVLRRIEEFFLRPDLETRAAFDEFIVERQRIQSALQICDEFIDKLNRLKVSYTAEDAARRDLRDALRMVQRYCETLEQRLQGTDDPDLPHDED